MLQGKIDRLADEKADAAQLQQVDTEVTSHRLPAEAREPGLADEGGDGPGERGHDHCDVKCE